MQIKEAVIERLLELCEQNQSNPNQLARWSGVPPSTLKSILYGKSKNPGIVTLKQLCDGLGIFINDFFNTETFRSLEQEIK